jgi:hypothetical protein
VAAGRQAIVIVAGEQQFAATNSLGGAADLTQNMSEYYLYDK